MRIASIAGRAHLIQSDSAVDIASASNNLFPSDPQGLYRRWDEFSEWAKTLDLDELDSARSFEQRDLGNPVGHPRQVFAIGLNYADHARESKLEPPAEPVVFTKFVSSFAGPDSDVTLPSDMVDWEAELVAVIGRGGRDIPRSEGWDHIAGFTVGQDLSDRTIQWWAPPAQFSLGKSLENFAPLGPWVTSIEEIRAEHDPQNLKIGCTLEEANGSTSILQSGSTSQMIFSLPVLVEKLSALVELLPGDVIFSGTPAGVGMGMNPPTYLKPGQTLITTIEGIGSITQRFRSSNP
ncbi:fumarylacetoacetate hydrolase family protein [Arthrobacter sp. ISL-28]|uniref:fumarylacetoacetate hydrolase family protein n=1 Tax=Arthrobacter sp. ISL-28 TaxID=2819108 RepID=UPI001BEC3349|nr:fumarylacetoacetate hydrolase family protein [Arthrobacter sp. ISL-28]MBT2519909.1 fumarylacetoacetate hydrolase family protein [Arthrobacter sp. ISL-28]